MTYISREAAESALKQPVTMSMCLTLEECRQKNAQRQIDLFVIRGLPAADVRPVVTCGECIHGQGKKMDFWNEYEGIECIGGVVHRKDWFCADGAKREES